MVVGEISDTVPPSASDPLRLVITLVALPVPGLLVKLAAVIPSLNSNVPLVSVNVTVAPLKVHTPELQVLGESVPPEMVSVPLFPVTVSVNPGPKVAQPPPMHVPIEPELKVPVTNVSVLASLSALVKLMLFANAAVVKATAKSVNSMTRLILLLSRTLPVGRGSWASFRFCRLRLAILGLFLRSFCVSWERPAVTSDSCCQTAAGQWLRLTQRN